MAVQGPVKVQLRSRLVKAAGHLNAVIRMVDDEKYCIDILNQLRAVQAALDKTAHLILKQHLETCVVDAIKADDSKRVMDELWDLLRHGYFDDGTVPETLERETTNCCSSDK